VAEIPINQIDKGFKTGTQLRKRVIFSADASKTKITADPASRLKRATGNDLIGFEKKGTNG
jgi:hypothetical protein